MPLVLAVLLRRRGALENEVHIVTCNKAVRAIQLQSIYFCDSGVLAGALSTLLISVPTVPGAFLLARSGDFVLFDVSDPKSPKARYQAFISVDNQQALHVALAKTTANGSSVATVDGEVRQRIEVNHYETEPREKARKAGQSEDKEGFDLLLEAADIDAALLKTALQEESARRAIFSQAEVERYRDRTSVITNPQGADSNEALGVVIANPPIVAAWSWEVLAEAGEPAVLLVATDAGSIHRVHLTIDEAVANTIIVQKTRIRVSPRCYQGPACTSLLCLPGGYVAAVGDMGDGHVLQAELDGFLISRSSLQNIAPMFDFELVDYDGEKQDQMVACCGAGDEGTMRVIRNAISVEQLLTSPPSFPGITATWPLRIRQSDTYHSILVMSFLEETRVLSVGLNFDDRTDTTGFNSGASTLACGRVEDGWLVQICASEIRLCSPAMEDNAAVPLVSSWSAPTSGDGGAIRVGAVAQGIILVALSRLGTLFLLGTELGNVGIRHVVELQRCHVNAEISCISIPQEERRKDEPPTSSSTSDGQRTYQSGLSQSTSVTNADASIPGFEIGKICVIGTYQPSVEILSLVPGEAFRQLAVEPLVQVTPSGTSHGGCIPESVQLIHVDRLYVLVGLRNGMLLRYHWLASPVEGLGSFRKHSGSNSSDLSTSGLPFSHQPSIQDKSNTLHGKTVHISGNHAGRNREPAILHLMDVRRIGVSPVSLTLLRTSLHSDVVALSDRPWLLQAVQHRQQIAYTPIAFRASSHATALSCIGCPLGLLFIADCCLHLVEMEQSKRLSVQQIPVGRTPRHLVYHSVSKTLIIICTSIGASGEPPICEVRCIDPVGGQVHFTHKLEAGELALSVQVWQPHGEQLVVVGTGPANALPLLPHDGGKAVRGRLLIFRVQPKQSSIRTRIGHVSPPLRHSSPSVHPIPGNFSPGVSGIPVISTDPMSSWSSSAWMKDNVVVRETIETWARERSEGMGHRGKGTFQEGEGGRDIESGATVQAEGAWELQLHTTYYHVLGPVMCLCTYLGNYLLAGAGNALIVLSMVQEKNGDQRLKRMSKAMTRFGITCIATNLTRIAVGDCRDGVLLYSYREDTGQLELLLCDPSHRLVADCTLIDPDTAIVTDKHGNLCSLTTSPGAEGNSNPERNLGIGCWFHMAEIALRIRKGSLSYRAPVEDMGGDPYCQLPAVRMAAQLKSSSALVAATMLGSVLFFLRLTREEYELLAAVERRVAAYPLTAPLLGNDHARFRSRGSPPGVARVLDGDMLEQFLALPTVQQQTVLAKRSRRPLEPADRSALLPCHGNMWLHLANEEGEEEVADIPLEKVLRLLELVHHSID